MKGLLKCGIEGKKRGCRAYGRVGRGRQQSVNDVLLALGQTTSQPPIILMATTMLTDLHYRQTDAVHRDDGVCVSRKGKFICKAQFVHKVIISALQNKTKAIIKTKANIINQYIE